MSDLLTVILLTGAAICCIAFGFLCAVNLRAALRSRDRGGVIANAVLLALASCSLFSVLSMCVL